MPPDSRIPIAALVPAPGGAVVADADGARRIDLAEARALFRSGAVLVAHAAFVAGRLGIQPAAPLYDLLELFTFVRPGAVLVPSALGLARSLDLPLPQTPEESAGCLGEAAALLIEEATALDRAAVAPLLATLARAGWRWAGVLQSALGESMPSAANPLAGYETWRGLSPWEDEPAPGTPGSIGVTPAEARARLARLVGPEGEPREAQAAYSDAATYAFGPREQAGRPRIALLEAGTGIGKTLGYLAPASIWAEKNGPGLWISTYTRNLQRQILQEIARLYPDPAERAEKAVLRKGRENYLCLLNFEDATKRSALAPGQFAVALGLIARWISATGDGDISGAGFPAFLGASMALQGVTDRRGECIYAACPHYRVCFIERAVRRARRAPIVVANHALVIASAARDWQSVDETTDAPAETRLRFVFDEGHHLFDAADSGFAARLTGREMADLRRWIRGPEGRRGASRTRGLGERLGDLIGADTEARDNLDAALLAAGALAGEGWLTRMQGAGARGPGENFLGLVHVRVRALGDDRDGFYTIESPARPAGDELRAAGNELARALRRLAEPLLRLAQLLRATLDRESAILDASTAARLRAAVRGLEWRAKIVIAAWTAMLENLSADGTPEEFADWFEIAREEGREVDVGLKRHWIDPTVPFAEEVLAQAHGALITSATLRDVGATLPDAGQDDSGESDWASAEMRTGAHHLPEPPRRASFGSPFDYRRQARIFIIGGVGRGDADARAAAMRELFLASGGGALGLFTAVKALRAVQRRIAAPLAEKGIELYAQHVDRLDTGALVDLFRAEEHACLLGTDALRDGVDVPGNSLRLVVFDKVPWPKPTILHQARRQRFGRSYDDMLARLRLKQAFGRLIRGQGDRGCFVILEAAMPSRLLTAFPPEAEVRRCGLAEAVAEIKAFLQSGGEDAPGP